MYFKNGILTKCIINFFLKLFNYLQVILINGFVLAFQLQGSVVPKVNSAIHRIVIYSNFLNMFSNW